MGRACTGGREASRRAAGLGGFAEAAQEELEREDLAGTRLVLVRQREGALGDRDGRRDAVVRGEETRQGGQALPAGGGLLRGGAGVDQALAEALGGEVAAG